MAGRKKTNKKRQMKWDQKVMKKPFLIRTILYVPIIYYQIFRWVLYKTKTRYKTLVTRWQSYSSIICAIKKDKQILLNKKVKSYRTQIKKIPVPKIPRLDFSKPEIKLPSITLTPFALILKPFKWFFNIEIRFKVFSFKTISLAVLLVSIYLGSILYFTIIEDMPSTNKLLQYDPRLTTRIYDRKGNILYRVYQDEDRTLTNIEDIPDDLIHATVAIEDQDFYEHKGLDPRGIIRAAKKTFLEEDLEGGSTITQQLVKNVMLTPERTFERKIKEAIIAVEIERSLSKDEIIEMYLNTISYGGTAYGVEAAAKKYFGVPLDELSLAQSAYLAGLPAAPTVYSPFGSQPQLGKSRQKEVLNRMVLDGYISNKEAEEAYDEGLIFAYQRENIRAPHFVNYVLGHLEEKYGQQLVQQGGLDVYTSIDLELQNELETIVEKNVQLLARNNVTNGAALITNPETGEVLAMVGSVDFWDIENDGNVNVTISPRQPGSSIKPITYSLALENGYSPSSTIVDSPISYGILGHRPYVPVNYDGGYHGTMTLKTALANSYNIPAVKLLDKLGVTSLIAHGKNMGITTWNDSERYGLSLTLGAGEVKMTDMATAYGVFANGGYKQEVNPILKVYDSFGNVIDENSCVNFLEESPSILSRKAIFEVSALAAETSNRNSNALPGCEKEQVIDESSAFFIGHMLSDNAARVPAFGGGSSLEIREKQVAVKTGTTTNVKDNWTIGYTDNYVVAAWIGNNNGDKMKNVVSGYRGASNIWRDTFDYLIASREVNDTLKIPAGIVEVSICPLTNTLACEGCPNIKAIYKKGTEPKVACNPDSVKQILEDKAKKEKEKNKDDEDD